MTTYQHGTMTIGGFTFLARRIEHTRTTASWRIHLGGELHPSWAVDWQPGPEHRGYMVRWAPGRGLPEHDHNVVGFTRCTTNHTEGAAVIGQLSDQLLRAALDANRPDPTLTWHEVVVTNRYLVAVTGSNPERHGLTAHQAAVEVDHLGTHDTELPTRVWAHACNVDTSPMPRNRGEWPTEAQATVDA